MHSYERNQSYCKIFKQVYGAEIGLYYDKWCDIAAGVVAPLIPA